MWGGRTTSCANKNGHYWLHLHRYKYKFSDDWIQTTDLWCGKQPLYLLRHDWRTWILVMSSMKTLPWTPKPCKHAMLYFALCSKLGSALKPKINYPSHHKSPVTAHNCWQLLQVKKFYSAGPRNCLARKPLSLSLVRILFAPVPLRLTPLLLLGRLQLCLCFNLQ